MAWQVFEEKIFGKKGFLCWLFQKLWQNEKKMPNGSQLNLFSAQYCVWQARGYSNKKNSGYASLEVMGSKF